MATHYEVLGVAKTATAAEVKSAYRKVVLQHHPDRSKDPKSNDIFIAATEAYEVLSDPERRKTYDDTLERIARHNAEKAAAAAQAGQRPRVTGYTTSQAPRVTADVQRLTSLFAKGRHAEAEALARQITQTDPKQPIPYAVLGDIARSRGRINEAAKMYAYAAQFDPSNALYQRKYEELLGSSKVVTDRNSSMRLEAHEQSYAPVAVGASLVLMGTIFVALSGGEALFTQASLISTWTLGLLFVLFTAGVAVGSSLAIGNLLDRFHSMTSSAIGRVGPAVVLGLVAVVNFWLAAILYLTLGLAQRSFNYSTTRLLTGVALAVFLITLGAQFGPLDPGQVVLWGGNVIYLGALLGWMVADAFKS